MQSGLNDTSTFNEIVLDEMLERIIQHNYFDFEEPPQMLFIIPENQQPHSKLYDEYEYCVRS